MRIDSKHIYWVFVLLAFVSASCKSQQGDSAVLKKRVLISSDIGGTDPDDFQSMIHLLMYGDQVQIEGIISSPYGLGRKEHIYGIIDLYEKDLPQLKKHGDFPSPAYLRAVTKQGAINKAPAKGWSEPSEGSEWIIKQAKVESIQPLWVLVWGGLEDLAQALHDAPEIQDKIKVYWIGGPNKKWSVDTYVYIARNFPDLWMIEANSTYRGWIIDDEARPGFGQNEFYERSIKGRGALGTDFGNYYGGRIKMGDTPSLAYLLNGDPEDPEGESWGGSFIKLPFSAFRSYDRNTNDLDTIPAYSVCEWSFESNEPKTDSAFIWMEIAGQRIDGFMDIQTSEVSKTPEVYTYKVRFVPKKDDNWDYEVYSSASDLQGQRGSFVSVNPWPGMDHPENINLNHWWSDRTEETTWLQNYPGARTVSKWREEFLSDWAERFDWLTE